MTTYQIEQTRTAVILWEGEARDEKHALELMSQDAGYADHAAAVDAVGEDSGVVVREVHSKRCGGCVRCDPNPHDRSP